MTSTQSFVNGSGMAKYGKEWEVRGNSSGGMSVRDEPCSVFISFPQDLGGKRDIPLFNVNFLYFILCTVLLWGFSQRLGALHWILQSCWLQGRDPVRFCGCSGTQGPWAGSRAAPGSSQESLSQADLIDTPPPAFLWQNTLCVLGGQAVSVAL